MIISEIKNKISNAKDIYIIIKRLIRARQETEQHKEYFYTLCLDSQNNIICVDLSAIGTVNTASPYIREILRIALIKNAVSIIISHNHPSNNTAPSQQDKTFTKKLINACNIINIKLLDHIIVCDYDYFSFADEEIL